MTTAVLARTNRALRPIEEALGRESIPYFLLGKSGFYHQPEIRTALAFAQTAVFPSDASLAVAARSSLWPAKFLPKTKLLARLKEIQDAEEAEESSSYWRLLKTPTDLVEPKNVESVRNFVQFIHGLSRYRSLPAGEATKKILVDLRAFDYYADEPTAPDNDAVGNLNDLVKIAARFPDLKGFLDYARKVSAASKTRRGVALSTIHGSKGLEFDKVFLVGCQEGLMPHAKSTDAAEESNLMFVASSRAARELVITYSGKASVYLAPFIKKEGANAEIRSNLARNERNAILGSR